MKILKIILMILAVCAAMPTLAAPFAENISFTQPDGTEIVLFGEGDEFYAVFETLDGYTVVFNQQTKAYEYAQLSADGSTLVSSGLIVGRSDPKKLKTAKHLRINPEDVKKQAKERFEKWDMGVQVTERWNQLKAVRRQATLNAADGTEAALSDEPLMAPPSATTTGTKTGLTLLIDFDDDPATVPQAEIVDYCNGDNYTGYGNNGSVKKYFQDNSGGLLTYSNVVTVYIRMPNSLHPKSWYNDTSKDCGVQANLLIRDAITIMKALPNYETEILPAFAGLTVDSSSRVIACNVFYAGGNGGVWRFGLWPHSWSLYNVGEQALGNGKSIYKYQVTNIGTSLTISTFCHENGHMLCGFPDIYDYGRDSYGGAGSFCLMGSGVSSLNPAQFCAYLKRAAGWATTIDIAGDSGFTASVSSSGADFNKFYRYQKPGVPTEYFLVENRQKTGRDANLAASGIAIWHIDELGNKDYQNTNYNTIHTNYEVSLMQADNLWHFQNDINSGDSKDLYYSGNSAAGYINQFNDFSSPNSYWWDGTASGVGFHSFSASAATMTFSVGDPPPSASVTLSLSDSPMAEAGGVARVTATLSSAYTVPVTVNLAFSGTAIWPNDYSRSGTSIVIATGNMTNSITLTAISDKVYEGDETIVVDVSSVVNGTESDVQQVTAVITDDDPYLNVNPPSGVSFAGLTGGVSSPSNQVFMLTNSGIGTLIWRAARASNWAILSATNGTLAEGGSTNVTVSVNIGALTNGNYSNVITFSNVTSGASLTRMVSLTVLPDIYFFPLDTDPGWARSGEWAFGHPTGQGGVAFGSPDPSDGYTGVNVFGVNLNGDYLPVPGDPYYLAVGPLNFSNYTNVSLHFQRWLNTDMQGAVNVSVEVSGNGTTWTPIYAGTNALTVSTNWTNCQYDISGVADRRSTVYVRWGYKVYNNQYALSGWNIDDIGFLGTLAPPSSTDRDGDGLPDSWELQYFGGDTNANPNALAANGVNTVLGTYVAGLNPTNAASFFKVSSFALPSASNGGFVVRWSAVTGRVYGVHWTTNLKNSFLPLGTNIVWPQASYTDTVHGTESRIFYKIKVQLAP